MAGRVERDDPEAAARGASGTKPRELRAAALPAVHEEHGTRRVELASASPRRASTLHVGSQPSFVADAARPRRSRCASASQDGRS